MCETQTNREALKIYKISKCLEQFILSTFFNAGWRPQYNRPIVAVFHHHEKYIYAFLLARSNNRMGEIPHQ